MSSCSSIMITASATVKKSPDPPTTRIVETSSSWKSGRTFRTKAVMGSLSGATKAFIFSSRIIKLVAQVSWFKRSAEGEGYEQHPKKPGTGDVKIVGNCHNVSYLMVLRSCRGTLHPSLVLKQILQNQVSEVVGFSMFFHGSG